jgi:hypothetical protein
MLRTRKRVPNVTNSGSPERGADGGQGEIAYDGSCRRPADGGS